MGVGKWVKFEMGKCHVRVKDFWDVNKSKNENEANVEEKKSKVKIWFTSFGKNLKWHEKCGL